MTGANPRAWWVAATATTLVLMLPLFMTPIPPLLDYPNHLARMLVILLRDDPVLSRIYSVDFRLVPNVAMDLTVPPLATLMPLDIAGRIFIGACLILPLAGACVLHRALFHRRAWWPLGMALVSYNGVLFLGFLNFLAGLGLALLAAGVWVRQAEETTTRRLATASLFALALLLCHLTAVGFLALLVGAIELRSYLGSPASERSRRALVRRAALVAAPFVAPLGAFVAGAPLAGKLLTGTDQAVPATWWPALAFEGLAGKFVGLTAPFRTYPPPFAAFHPNLDLFAFVLLVVFVLRALSRRCLSVAPALLIVAALTMIAYPLVPPELGNTAVIDWRLPLFATFLCIVAVDPAPPRDGFTVALTCALAVIFVARIAVIGVVWNGHNRDLDDLARVIAPIEAGAKVLAVTTTPLPIPGGDPASRGILYEIDATMHLPALVLLRQHAFWPNLFTSENLQPVHVRPPYRALSIDQGPLPTVAELTAPAARVPRGKPYRANWRADFDYVLVMRPAALPSPPDPAVLEPLGRADIAALYRVRH